jgi:hypothetical protein
MVTEDPLRGVPIGAKLRISASLFKGRPKDLGLNSIANWDFFEGALVAVSFGADKHQHILGTGALVAPGVVMTARHVLEAQEELLRRGDREIMCFGIDPQGLILWRCRAVTLVGNSDIAFLMVEAASALPKVLHQVTLTTRMPRIGEEVIIVGIRHHSAVPVPIAADTKLSMMTSVGKVTARYEHRRDSVLLPHPCFEASCGAIGGMSGGAAFDRDGFLIGIISSSLESETPGPTFLSMPWPAFAEMINPIWPAGFYEGPTSLLQLDRRICGLHRPEALVVSDSSSGQSVTYSHWDTEQPGLSR